MTYHSFDMYLNGSTYTWNGRNRQPATTCKTINYVQRKKLEKKIFEFWWNMKRIGKMELTEK